jgi:hypothetical protein
MGPGQTERRTHDYKRYGTTSLFAALDAKTGTMLAETPRRPRSIEFVSTLIASTRRRPPISTYTPFWTTTARARRRRFQRWLAKCPRYHVHVTPTYGSWLNQAERPLSELATRQLRRGAHPSVTDSSAPSGRSSRRTTTNRSRSCGRRVADEMLASIARFAQRTSAVKTSSPNHVH